MENINSIKKKVCRGCAGKYNGCEQTQLDIVRCQNLIKENKYIGDD